MKKLRRLRRLKLDRVDLVGAGANPGAYVALHKSDEPRTNETGGTIKTMTDAEKAAAEQAAVEAKAESDEAAAKKAPDEVAAKAEDEDAGVAKAEREALAKKLEVAEDEIVKMKEREELREFTEFAKSNLGSLPEKPETMGGLLRKAKAALEDGEYQTLTRLLKAANAQADTSKLFAQFGDSEDREPESLEDQVEKAAKKLIEADPTLTVAQATAKVMADSPELRKAYGKGN